VSADYSQIELRIMAHLSGDAGLLGAFANGEDVHRATAGEIFGVTPLEVTSEQRRYAKVINFGLIYGMSARSASPRTSASNAPPPTTSTATSPATPASPPTWSAPVRGARAGLRRDRLRPPPAPAGHPRQQVGRRQGAERAAINAPMQGTAADLIKKAMIAGAGLARQEAGSSRGSSCRCTTSWCSKCPTPKSTLMREQLPA
jgi:DNA polymerase-1